MPSRRFPRCSFAACLSPHACMPACLPATAWMHAGYHHACTVPCRVLTHMHQPPPWSMWSRLSFRCCLAVCSLSHAQHISRKWTGTCLNKDTHKQCISPGKKQVKQNWLSWHACTALHCCRSYASLAECSHSCSYTGRSAEYQALLVIVRPLADRYPALHAAWPCKI